MSKASRMNRARFAVLDKSNKNVVQQRFVSRVFPQGSSVLQMTTIGSSSDDQAYTTRHHDHELIVCLTAFLEYSIQLSPTTTALDLSRPITIKQFKHVCISFLMGNLGTTSRTSILEKKLILSLADQSPLCSQYEIHCIDPFTPH